MFRNKFKKRLKDNGTLVDCQYLLFVNNQDPMTFPTREAALSYIQKYRKETEIFKLQIFRVETYSL